MRTVTEGSPAGDEYELGAGVHGYAIERDGAIYIPVIRAEHEGSGDVGRFLDGLPENARVPNVTSGRLRGMLERRRWKPIAEFDESFGEEVQVYVHPGACPACGCSPRGENYQNCTRCNEGAPHECPAEPMTCANCAKPATCFGVYEDSQDDVEFACDECCGHGNEDGWCEPINIGPRASAMIMDIATKVSELTNGRIKIGLLNDRLVVGAVGGTEPNLDALFGTFRGLRFRVAELEAERVEDAFKVRAVAARSYMQILDDAAEVDGDPLPMLRTFSEWLISGKEPS